MSASTDEQPQRVPAIVVRQWLEEWNKVPWDDAAARNRPEKEYFYVASMPAATLRKLSGVPIRAANPKNPETRGLDYQRFHDRERSREIGRYVRYGFPWSELSPQKRQSGQNDDLRKPGWLPTAIVVNIVQAGERRGSSVLRDEHAITVSDLDRRTAEFVLPITFPGQDDLAPLEVIDGQHRLFAFEEHFGEDFDLPVIAFHGLARSWQAYLFWTINIRPKRINASLAFDLYPMLRTEDWLEKFFGHSIYRETRAQEMVETLWFHKDSPWRARINMLGESSKQSTSKGPTVSQAAWVRSLLATYVKSWEGPGVRIGGLFGAPVDGHQTVLAWTRAQQAAFLMTVWIEVQKAIREYSGEWATSVRPSGQPIAPDDDPAFDGEHSLLATDQGVRAILYLTNDLCYVTANELQLSQWAEVASASDDGNDAVASALDTVSSQRFKDFLALIAGSIASFD